MMVPIGSSMTFYHGKTLKLYENKYGLMNCGKNLINSVLQVFLAQMIRTESMLDGQMLQIILKASGYHGVPLPIGESLASNWFASRNTMTLPLMGIGLLPMDQ